MFKYLFVMLNFIDIFLFSFFILKRLKIFDMAIFKFLIVLKLKFVCAVILDSVNFIIIIYLVLGGIVNIIWFIFNFCSFI